MTQPNLRLGSRTLANAARGLGASLPLAMLAPVLARHLGTDEFAVWVLVVQVASYVSYLEFGVQTAVSRTVAFRYARDGIDAARGPMAAGVRLLFGFGAAGLVLVAVSAMVLPRFVAIPDGLVDTTRVALIVLGTGAAITLPGSAMHGALVGAGRHWSSAVTVLVARAVSVSLTIFGAIQGWSVAALAGCLALGSVINGVGPFAAARLAAFPSPWCRPHSDDTHEIRGITATVGTWTLATLVISGIDILVVSIIDFDSVSAYGLAANLAIVATATYGILSSVLIPAFADQAGRNDAIGAERLLARTTAASCAVLGAGLILSLTIRDWVVSAWAGQYADEALPIFVVLIITAAVRLSMSPVATFVMGFGRHETARSPAVIEATLNLVLSIAGGLIFGAIGVALASLVASGSAVVLYLGRIGPSTLEPHRFRELILPRYGRSAASAAPFIGALLLVDGAGLRAVLGALGIIVQIVVVGASLRELTPELPAAAPRTPDPTVQ